MHNFINLILILREYAILMNQIKVKENHKIIKILSNGSMK